MPPLEQQHWSLLLFSGHTIKISPFKVIEFRKLRSQVQGSDPV